MLPFASSVRDELVGATSTSTVPNQTPTAESPRIFPLPRGAKAVFSTGGRGFAIGIGDAQPISIPMRFNPIVALFAQKALSESPCEVVGWEFLNKAADPHAEYQKKATRLLRKRLSELNTFLTTEIGTPADGKRWIASERAFGAFLNRSITWDSSDRIAEMFHSDNPEIAAALDPSNTLKRKQHTVASKDMKSRRQRNLRMTPHRYDCAPSA